ncbi:MAG: BON domain-containing protein [Rhodoferax sp.]|nr:BON domain-containing protein [Rhodoferax sp.]
MKNPLGLRILTSTVAGVMTISMVACGQTNEPASAPAATTTVGTDVDDTLLTTHVKTALADNIDIKSFDIKVETRKGEVMLSGFVDNQTQIDRAIAVAQAIPGVKSVDNRVSIKAGTTTIGTKIDDSIITAKVKAALMADETVKSADIAAVTRDGRVQLSGFVNNQKQIDNALQVARGIEGVSSVGNELSIKQ